MNSYLKTFVKNLTLFFSSTRQMGGVNPLKTEVDLQMSITNTDLHAVWEKSQPHCWNLAHFTYSSICLRARQCQPTCTDFVIQELSPQPFLLLVMVNVCVPWRQAFFHELPYVIKIDSEILGISYFEPCTNCVA